MVNQTGLVIGTIEKVSRKCEATWWNWTWGGWAD